MMFFNIFYISDPKTLKIQSRTRIVDPLPCMNLKVWYICSEILYLNKTLQL